MYIENFLKQDSLNKIKQQINIQQDKINEGIKNRELNVIQSGIDQISQLFNEREETLDTAAELGNTQKNQITRESYNTLFSKIIQSRTELMRLMIKHEEFKNEFKSVKKQLID